MKLIFLNRYFHPDISATSQILSSLSFRLAVEGAEVHVITSRQCYDDPWAALPMAEVMRGVHVHRVLTSRFGRANLTGRASDYASFYMTATLKLAGIARPGDVVIAMTDPPIVSFPAALAARLRRARLVNWLQDVFPEAAERAGMRLAYAATLARILRDFSLRIALVNVVLGERMRKQVEAVPGAAKVRVIHNWADGTQIFPIPAEENPIREAWGLAGKFVVAYSGNMGRAHDFESILDAAVMLRNHPNIAFLFVGGGHRHQQVLDGAKARNLSNMAFHPYQPQQRLAASLCAGDLHLVTLIPAMEGLIVPSKIYGILAAGRPAINIGDAAGEVARIIAGASAGFTIPTGDSTLLAQRILEFASNPALCAELGSNARSAFDALYSEKIAFERWKKLLLDVDARVFG